MLKIALAFLTFIVALTTYWLTIAPTLSFWDPGEYIAAAHILGIPHPPGAPFFMLMGRFFILLLPFDEVALRMNFLSAFYSALAVATTFLFTEKLVKLTLGETLSRFSRYSAALIAAFLVTFSQTFWFNAVEAEKDGFSMFFLMLVSWLSLLWIENRNNATGTRLLILLFYLAFLGFGIQNFTVMTLPAILVLIIMMDRDIRFNVPLLVIFVGALVLIGDTGRFIPENLHLFVQLALLGGAIAAGVAYFKTIDLDRKTHWMMVGWFFVTAVFGFSTEVSISESGLALYLLLTASLPAWLFIRHIWTGSGRLHIPILVTGLLLLSVIYDVGNFQWYALGAFGMAVAGWIFSSDVAWKGKWSLSMWLCIFSFLGASTFAYIPIRSSLNPNIDENNPETYAAFKQFVERKQYGSESMLRRAFHRRGTLENQFLTHPHMGYGGFLLSQYLPWKVGDSSPQTRRPVTRGSLDFSPQMEWMGGNRGLQLFLFLLFHIPVFLALKRAYRANKPLGTYAFLLYFLTSFGLIFYMNFSDGTQMELRDYQYWLDSGKNPQQQPAPVHLEVRERDYFFSPTFIFFSVLFALAGAFLLRSIESMPRLSRLRLSKGVAVALVSAAIALPAFSNYKEQNRSGIYVPYDYAYNLLQSCRPNSVLFTNGDNDTFPLWFMQEVENIRRDVRVVNLSLVNTDWYIHQLRDNEPKLVLGFTRDEITGIGPQPWPSQGKITWTAPAAGITVELERRSYLKVQDIMVLHIVQNNFPQRPIHFAISVSDGNMMGLDEYVQMEGMVYTLTTEKRKKALDPERTAYLVDSVYQFRGLGDGTTYIDSNTEGLLSNYSSVNFHLTMWVQDSLARIDANLRNLRNAASNDSEETASQKLRELETEREALVEMGTKYLSLNERILPNEWRTYYYSGQFYAQLGRFDAAEEQFAKGMERGPEPRMFEAQRIRMLLEKGDSGRAESLMASALERNPDDFEMAYGLSEIYLNSNKPAEARNILGRWLERNPQHQYAGAIGQQIRMLDQRMRAPDPAPDTGVIP